jgi:hypothetical protein
MMKGTTTLAMMMIVTAMPASALAQGEVARSEATDPAATVPPAAPPPAPVEQNPPVPVPAPAPAATVAPTTPVTATAPVVPVAPAASVASIGAFDRPRPRLIAMRTRTAPSIDGDLRDAAWAEAAITTAFTQKFPDEAKAPTEPTELRVIYDDRMLYIAFNCVQRGVPVKGRLARRDREVEADWVQVAIDDSTNTYQFAINAAGVLGDGVRFNDTDYSADWNGVWEGKVARSAAGWSAELSIPLRIFRHAEGVQDWGFQARRYISERQETAEWSFIPRAQAGEVSHYGRLSGIADIPSGNPIELLPYVTAGLQWADTRERGSFIGDFGGDGNAGLDLSWRLGKRLQLDAAFNPDFAQVEDDELLLNLTTFETFVPEKRPFFINGMELFETPRVEVFPSSMTMFYTRRIGSVPDVPAEPVGDGVFEAPEPGAIYAAAKLSGQVAGGVDASLLSALTGRSDLTADYPPAADAPTRESVTYVAEPMALANVARVRASVIDGATVGLLATAMNRFEPTGEYPRMMARDGGEATALCPDGSVRAFGSRCFHDAYAAGLDAAWRSLDGTYAVAAQGIGTLIQNGPPRTMRDGTVIESGDVDSTMRLYAAKEGGQWLGSVELDRVGRRADFNDLGFLQRQNQLRMVPYVEVRTLAPVWEFAELSGHAFASYRDNLDGLDLLHGYYLGGEARFKNFWTAAAELYVYSSRFDDREMGDGAALERPKVLGGDFSMATDPRRQLAGSLSTETFLFLRGGHSFRLDGEVSYQPLPSLELQLQPQLVDVAGDPRYLEGDGQGSYLFGEQSARSVGATLRTNYTFSNSLTLQLYGQLLLVAKHYSDFSSYTAPGAAAKPVVHLDDLQPMQVPLADFDSAETSLNLNAVLRWEFRPGSTMFLVYSRFQAPELALDGQDAELDLGALGDGEAIDSLRVKVSYYWN